MAADSRCPDTDGLAARAATGGRVPYRGRPGDPQLRSRPMCFKNLPIEIDEQGRMTLRADAEAAYGLRERPRTTGPRPLSEEQIRTLVARNGYIKDVDFDPVTRVAGALAFHAV